MTNNPTTIGLKKYLDNSTGWMPQLVNTHGKQYKYSISKESDKFVYQLTLTLKEIDTLDKATEVAKTKKKESKTQALNQLKNVWEQTPLHG